MKVMTGWYLSSSESYFAQTRSAFWPSGVFTSLSRAKAPFCSFGMGFRPGIVPHQLRPRRKQAGKQCSHCQIPFDSHRCSFPQKEFVAFFLKYYKQKKLESNDFAKFPV